jgi:hypothetical protein
MKPPPNGGLTSPCGSVALVSPAKQGNLIMKLAVIGLATFAATLTPLIAPAPAEAKGCLKGAVVGGVAGHYAGHHAILGAIGGCVVGHHLANEKSKEAPAAAAQGEPAPQAAAPPAHNGY